MNMCEVNAMPIWNVVLQQQIMGVRCGSHLSECGESLAALEILECGAPSHRFKIFWIAVRPPYRSGFATRLVSLWECGNFIAALLYFGLRHVLVSLSNYGTCPLLLWF